MGKALIITEKPSVARDVVKALGGFVEKNKGEYYESDQFVCTYAVGHILSLVAPEDIDEKYRRWRLSDLPIIPETFRLKPVERQENRLKVIEKLMKRDDVDCLINACDAAREGELIFREIVEYTGVKKPIKRLWLQSMTKDAIRQGFQQLADGQKYEGLAAAAACRSHSDWVIGMNATRALTVRLKTRNQRGASWSAGRVQTPTLAMLVKRELEILEHEPIPYFKIEGLFAASDHEYAGYWFDPDFKREDNRDKKEDRIFDKDFVEKIVNEVKGKEGQASEIRKPRQRKAPLLFDLTSLQREANRRFGMTAVRTLRAAQRCYETHKVLTYPRTSSRVLPEDYRDQVQKLLSILSQDKEYGSHAQVLLKQGLQNEKLVFNDAGVTDHFAIIPTGEFKRLEGDDARIFDLVVRQFLAAFYPPAVYEDIERITEVAGHKFKSKPPSVLKEPGWLAVFNKEEDTRHNFPPLVAGKNEVDGIPVKNKDVKVEEHETKPPPRIGEAGLLSLMENAGRQVEDEELSSALQKAEGLGTAATRADIIESLKTREYVDRSLRPTVKGIRLIDTLERINADVMTSPELTAKLELHLTEVELGQRSPQDFMDEVVAMTRKVVDVAREFDFEAIYPDENPLGLCPKCQTEVYERAWFYGCKEATKRTGSRRKCDFLIWKDHYGRYIDRRTVRLLLEKGETPELDGFKSQSGRSYKAVLALENGEVVRRPVEGSEVLDSDIKIELNEKPLGPCPVHKNEKCLVIETPTEYICQLKKKAKDEGDHQAQGFTFPRILCKREMKRDEVVKLIKEGTTDYLTRFISRKGRPFSARLRLQEGGGFTFEFPERKAKKSATDKEAQEESSTSHV